MSSNIILCNEFCPVCNSQMIIDLECDGDFFVTEKGIQRMRTCSNKNCAVQSPPLSGYDPMYLSRRGKETIGIKCAREYNLGIIETKRKARNIETNNKKIFARLFSEELRIPFIDVKKYTF